jgi:murein DD-endopeptidase MepM/ murein hydrolase activator NlpD
MRHLPLFLLSFFFLGSSVATASSPTLSLAPTSVIQGEPVLITIEGVAATSSVKSFLYNKKPVGVFLYKNIVSALIGIDLHEKPGTYPVVVTLVDGTVLTTNIAVAERPTIQAPLGIPEKLGGNTPASVGALISTLASENASLEHIRTGLKAFWSVPFRFPLASTTVTDPYGYSRQTGGYSIAHKGTDFRAKEGTPVMAINRGVVRIVTTYRDYGKTIVVDHGLGLMSFYMHLSHIYVSPGELVLPGEIIGASGQTGYAAQPHLHLSIRINGSSIDPMKFFALMQ